VKPQVRRLGPAEALPDILYALSGLSLQFRRELAERLLDEGFKDRDLHDLPDLTPLETEDFADWLRRPDGLCWIVPGPPGMPVAAYLLAEMSDEPDDLSRPPILCIDEIMVHPDLRRQGLAHALMTQALALARRRRARAVHVAAHEVNAPARTLLRSFGFVTTMRKMALRPDAKKATRADDDNGGPPGLPSRRRGGA
jgi:ribosomal protein S18 acetylase RimI-like enzyme